MIQGILVSLAAIALEAVTVLIFIGGGHALCAFAAHAAACVLLSVFAFRRVRRVKSLFGIGVWLFGVMLLVPVAGPLCAAVLFGIILYLPERLKEEKRVVVGIPESLSSTSSFFSNHTHPVVEVLASPDVAARREAILSLRSEVSAGAVLILQKAIGDSDGQVRNYAQSQLAKWTDESERKVKHLRTQAESPDATPEIFLFLAESLREMVIIHLAGPELETKYLKRALAWLDKIPAESPIRRNADLLSIPCHLRVRQIPAARAALQRLEESGYVHESLPGLRERVLFHERHWVAFLRELRTAPPDAPPDILQARAFWHQAPKVQTGQETSMSG